VTLRAIALAGLTLAAVGIIVVLGKERDSATSRERIATTPGRPASTRMVGQPLLFRFVGHQSTRQGNVIIPRLAYVVIFRLNRDPKRPGTTRDKIPFGSGTSRGNYELAQDIVFATDAPIFTLGQRNSKHCFYGVLPHGVYPSLDDRPVGRPVRFSAQPLTPSSSGDYVLGRQFVSYPRIMGSDISFKRRAARRALAGLGCLERAHQQFAG